MGTKYGGVRTPASLRCQTAPAVNRPRTDDWITSSREQPLSLTFRLFVKKIKKKSRFDEHGEGHEVIGGVKLKPRNKCFLKTVNCWESRW